MDVQLPLLLEQPVLTAPQKAALRWSQRQAQQGQARSQVRSRLALARGLLVRLSSWRQRRRAA